MYGNFVRNKKTERIVAEEKPKNESEGTLLDWRVVGVREPDRNS